MMPLPRIVTAGRSIESEVSRYVPGITRVDCVMTIPGVSRTDEDCVGAAERGDVTATNVLATMKKLWQRMHTSIA